MVMSTILTKILNKIELVHDPIINFFTCYLIIHLILIAFFYE